MKEEELKDSLIWLDKKICQLKTEKVMFEKGKNPIIENEMKKQIEGYFKIREELKNKLKEQI